MTNAEARFNKSLRPRKPEGSLGRTAQDVHLDSHTAPELSLVSVTALGPRPSVRPGDCNFIFYKSAVPVSGKVTVLTQHCPGLVLQSTGDCSGTRYRSQGHR